MRPYLIIFLALWLWTGCQSSTVESGLTTETKHQESISEKDSIPGKIVLQQEETKPAAPPEGWADIQQLAPSIINDIRYATDNNFIGQQIYDCPRCWLRPDVAEALVQVQQELQKENLGIKVFDCYRPRPMQQKLWDVKPDRRYVTDPAKGSMHNRGAAVDLTIVDADGQQLDMGTTFDFFGKEAWHEYKKLSPTILANRKKLKNLMETNGFRSIRTEWWHYAFVKGGHPLSDDLWPCH